MGKARIGPWLENHFEKREDLPPMETNEIATQYQAAEQALLKVIGAVEAIEDGDLKAVKETIYQGIFHTLSLSHSSFTVLAFPHFFSIGHAL